MCILKKIEYIEKKTDILQNNPIYSRKIHYIFIIMTPRPFRSFMNTRNLYNNNNNSYIYI